MQFDVRLTRLMLRILHFEQIIITHSRRRISYFSFRNYSKLTLHEQKHEETEFRNDDHNNVSPRASTALKTESELSEWPTIAAHVAKVLSPLGCEAHPFHIGWYNDVAGSTFRLNYRENTFCLVILGGPELFERCVIPFVQSQPKETSGSSGPLDESLKRVFESLSQELWRMHHSVDAIHSSDFGPSGKPKVLVQTAAHVAGAAEYFHRAQVNSKSTFWLNNSKLFGVAIHPEHGGWFTILGVIILKNLVPCNENVLPKPVRPLHQLDEAKIANLLEEFATNSKSNIWRDMLPRSKSTRYSQYFMDYLATEHDKRWEYVKSLLPIFKKRCGGD